jgi:hypothetical protein
MVRKFDKIWMAHFDIIIPNIAINRTKNETKTSFIYSRLFVIRSIEVKEPQLDLNFTLGDLLVIFCKLFRLIGPQMEAKQAH